MEPRERDIHIKVSQEEWALIKMEAIKRGMNMREFILGCIGEIVAQDEKYLK